MNDRRRPEPPLSPAFVGRRREIGILRTALDQARRGRGHLVMLVGDAGIGKTRLAEELAGMANGQDFRVLWGHCHEEEGSPPYWPWVEALRTHLGEEDPEDLDHLVESGAVWLAAILPELRAKLQGLDTPPSATPDSARFRLFSAVVDLLRRTARPKPILLILEDLHWADRSTLNLLRFVARGLTGSGVLLLGTTRTLELSHSQSPMDALAGIRFQTLGLRGLDRDGVRSLLVAIGGEPPPAAQVRAVHAQTEGNPFFVTEIATWMVLQGERSGQADEGSFDLPEGVRAVINRRLDLLSDESRHLLRAASVIGRTFDYGLLLEACGGPGEEMVSRAVSDGLGVHVLRVAGEGDRYEFRHALIWRALYEELGPAHRVRLHARVGEALEAVGGGGDREGAAVLAHHFARAERLVGTDRVVEYSRLAGERALAAHAYDEALVHFERALDRTDEAALGPRAAAIHSGLGRARAATSLRWNRQEAWKHLRRAAELHLERGEVHEAAAVATDPLLTPEGTWEIAGTIERVLERVVPGEREEGILRARLGAAIYFETGEYEPARAAFEQALSIARSREDPALELRALALKSAVDHFDGRWSDVEQESGRVIELARRIDDPHTETYAHYRLSLVMLLRGRSAEARLQARNTLVRAEALQDHGLLADALWVNAALEQLGGSWARARHLIHRGLELSPHHILLLHLAVMLEYEVGNADRGRENLARLADASDHAGRYPFRDAFLTVAIAQIARLTDGSPPVAPPRHAISKVGQPAAVVTLSRALVVVEEGDEEGAAILLRELAEEKGRILAPPTVTDRVLGLLAHTAGDRDLAMRHLRDALAFCQHAGYEPELAWVCHDLARVLLRNAEEEEWREAAFLLDKARTIATSQGMRPLANRLDRLRERLRTGLKGRLADLTARELDVLRLLAAGKTNKQMAKELFISRHTVALHVANVLKKTGCRNRTEAASLAIGSSLATPITEEESKPVEDSQF